MKKLILYPTSAIIATAIPLSARAQSLQTNRQAGAVTDRYASTPAACPAGWVSERWLYGQWPLAAGALRAP
jgi:hypothetical protein